MRQFRRTSPRPAIGISNPDFSSPGIDTSVDAANTSVCATPVVNSLFARNRGARSQRAVPALLPACLDRELMRNPG
jgi:hypothetical protein